MSFDTLLVFIVDDNSQIREQTCEYLRQVLPQPAEFKQASGLWELEDQLKARAKDARLRANTYGIVDLFNTYYLRRIEEIQHNRRLRASRKWELPQQKIGTFTPQDELLPRVALAAIDCYLRRYRDLYDFEPIVFTYMLTALHQEAEEDTTGRSAQFEQWLRHSLKNCHLGNNIVDKFEPPKEQVSESDLRKLATRLMTQIESRTSTEAHRFDHQ